VNSIVRLGVWSVIVLLLLVVLPAAGTQADGGSYVPSISPDARYVAFHSDATNLVSGDTNDLQDVFVRDRTTGTNYLVSRSSTGVLGNDWSYNPSVTADGRYVAYHSRATNLVAGDANAKIDIFVRDRQTGTTTRVSKDSAGVEGDGDSYNPTVSADGRYVAFRSEATNLVAGDLNGVQDVFVRDRQTGTTTLVSRNSGGVEGDGVSDGAFISPDGRYVTFRSEATNLVADDTNGMPDIFVRDRQTGTTTLVSRSSAGVVGDGSSDSPVISTNNRYVAFESTAANLAAGDTNTKWDIFVRDRQTGTTTLVSKSSAGVEGDEHSYYPSLSSDGRYVTFSSLAANLVTGDTNGFDDIFVRDRQTGTTTRVSKSSAGVEADSYSYHAPVSADGRFVVFESNAANLVSGDTNGDYDIFVRDRQTGTTTLISKS
jgi:Tol biopolymer transport system component